MTWTAKKPKVLKVLMVGEKKAMLSEEGKDEIEEQGSSRSGTLAIRLPLSQERGSLKKFFFKNGEIGDKRWIENTNLNLGHTSTIPARC